MFDIRSVYLKQMGAILLVVSFTLPFKVAAQLDDPTRPPGFPLIMPGGKKAQTGVTFTLSSVYISSSRRSAVINDKGVEIGQYVGGARVLNILPSSVKLKRRGKIFEVRLLPQVVKKTRAQ